MLMLNELWKKQLIITIFDNYVCTHVRYNFKLLTVLVLAYWLLNRHVNQSIVHYTKLQTTPVSLQLVLASYFEIRHTKVIIDIPYAHRYVSLSFTN